MRRREFLGVLSGAAATWPVVARGQQADRMPVIGFLGGTAAGPYAPFVAALRQGLQDVGYVEGRNITIEYRWADGQYDQLPALAADLVRRNVSLIVASTTPSVVAAKAATTTIPIVFSSNTDPVKLGVVASLNRPGGNVTGVANFSAELEAKRLALLHQLVPSAAVIGVLLNPNSPNASPQSQDVLTAARSLGLQVKTVSASNEGELGAAFASLADQKIEALIVGADGYFLSRRDQLATLATRHAIPTMFGRREYVIAGGLMSYASDLTDAYRLVGGYVSRILKGERTTELPVQQSTKVELIINLVTAKALGLTVPASLLALANEVVE
jgi:putative ABC transport system substrate-binding protein